MSSGKIIGQFLQKKLAGNFIFWLCCLLSYMALVSFGAWFYPDSKFAQQSIIVDMRGKVDGKFILVIFIAASFVIFIGCAVQAIFLKSRGGIEIIAAALDSGISQFLSAGSIFCSTAFGNLLLLIFEKVQTYDWYTLFTGGAFWFVAFTAYWILARLGAIKIE